MSFDRTGFLDQVVASDQPWLDVELKTQRLWLRQGETTLLEFQMSAALNVAGELNGSGCTPRGRHQVRAKIGAGAPNGGVFVGRRQTGELYDHALGRAFPERDWILTRILWLSGLEPGFNRFGELDTMRRYIYIHGCPDTEPMGVPGSAGCIRLRNHELLDLFERTPVATPVLINE